MENKTPEIIGLASDHAGFEMKEALKPYLESKGIAFKDYGTHSTESCDYPDFAHALARGMEAGEVSRGIAICGSGIGISIALNKHQTVRAALCWNEDVARLCRQHNDANVLCLPGRFVSQEEAEKMVDIYLTTPFEGGRHQRRIDKIPVK